MKTLSDLFHRFFSSGGFFKLRFSYKKNINYRRLFFLNSSKPALLKTTEKILVVGSGIASLSVLKSLRNLGHENVTVITRDKLFGGKCVNHGCMPSEYFSIKRDLSPNQRIKIGQEVIGKLRAITEQGFKDLRYPIIQGSVVEVKGTKLILSDGTGVDFERLILATGNKVETPPFLGDTQPLESFWELECEHLTIVSDHNVSSLSYAFIALDQGIKPTVIFTSKLAISHLPSFQHFYKELIRKGAQIIFEATSVERQGKVLKVSTREKTFDIGFDKIIYNGFPILNLPPIDGKTTDIFSIDYQTGLISNRSDIYLIGDSAGLLAASEAEFQGRSLINSWKSGKAIDMREIQKFPYRLHGEPSLAMVGAPWTLLKKDWRVVDFKNLGWSLIHGEEGKLWYLYDVHGDRVEAIHICHKNAGDLISLASVLIEFPASDPRWFNATVHPSSSEIFKALAENIVSLKIEKGRSLPKTGDKEKGLYLLPPLSQMYQSAFFTENFSEEERKLAILDPTPGHFLALLLGIKTISKNSNSGATLHLSSSGIYELPSRKDFGYKLLNPSSVEVYLENKSVIVNIASEEGV